MVPRIKLDPRHVWAFLSTLSGATSTLAYLIFFWNRPDGPAFIHLYSSATLSIGWMNTFCFLSGFSFFRNSRGEGCVAYAIAIALPIVLRFITFGEITAFSELLFLGGLALPAMLAPLFRERLALGEYRFVYRANIIFNFSLLIVAIAGMVMGERLLIYIGTFLLAPLGWATVLFFKGSKSGKGSGFLPAMLNPTLLLLERSLFDQRFLIASGVAAFTLPYYLLSRSITFVGSVGFAVGLERAFSGPKAESGYKKVFIALGILFFFLSMARSFQDARFVSVAGQAAVWLTVSWLVSISRLQPKRYLIVLLSLVPEILLHWGSLYLAVDLAPWVLRLLAANLLFIGFIQLKNQAGSQRDQ